MTWGAAPRSAEQFSDCVEVSELIDYGPPTCVKKDSVALIAVAGAFKDFRRDKAAGRSRLCRNMAADFLKNALHRSNRLGVKFTHCYSPSTRHTLRVEGGRLRSGGAHKKIKCSAEESPLVCAGVANYARTSATNRLPSEWRAMYLG